MKKKMLFYDGIIITEKLIRLIDWISPSVFAF